MGDRESCIVKRTFDGSVIFEFRCTQIENSEGIMASLRKTVSQIILLPVVLDIHEFLGVLRSNLLSKHPGVRKSHSDIVVTIGLMKE